VPLRFEPSRGEFEIFAGVQLGLVGLDLPAVAAEAEKVLARLERQFARIRSKYYIESGKPVLRLAHNAQFTVFLYWLSRELVASGRRVDADRIYALLRMVSGADIYYEVSLPDLWGCDHPLGSVIGRGTFAEDATFFFSQNCNIGNNGGAYPTVHGNLLMMPNSSLLGHMEVSGNVIMSNGACAIDAGKLSDCIVFGRSPDLITKPLEDARFRELNILKLPERRTK
jgi:serine O-acetyltransferase